MINYPFRKTYPNRSYSGKPFSDYRRYKIHLEQDFNGRCGYTDCNQFWFGGKSSFQIDHFKPKSKFPELLCEYTNLVYSCSYVNRAKSDDINEYFDPCNIDYNEHFYRDHLGNIYPKEDSPIAIYMYKKLKLYLKRYGIIWMLEELVEKMKSLRIIIEETGNPEARELFESFTFVYMDYLEYLKANQ